MILNWTEWGRWRTKGFEKLLQKGLFRNYGTRKIRDQKSCQIVRIRSVSTLFVDQPNKNYQSFSIALKELFQLQWMQRSMRIQKKLSCCR